MLVPGLSRSKDPGSIFPTGHLDRYSFPVRYKRAGTGTLFSAQYKDAGTELGVVVPDPCCQDRWGGTPLDDALRGGTLYHLYCAKLIQGWGGELGTLAGTEEGERKLKVRHGPTPCAVSWYCAMCSTEGYCAMQCAALTWAMQLHVISGTNVRYGATRCAVLRPGMVLPGARVRID
eukprot:2038483-Rhodomonas_salina.2